MYACKMEPKKHVDDNIYTIVTVAAAFMLLIAGCWMFFADFAYRDHGQLWVLAVFVVFTALACFSALKRTHKLTIILTVMAVAAMFYSNAKFDWRKTYIESKRANNAMMLDAYIAEYPSFEQYLFAGILGHEDPVRLSKNCLEPLVAGSAPESDSCASLAAMQQKYKIDALGLLTAYHDKMKATAKKINQGELKTAGEYAACIARKECATIPLLPAGVKANAIDSNSNKDYYDIRKAYWSLVKDEKLTPEVCGFIPLCAALGKAKLIDPKNPLGVTIQ